MMPATAPPPKIPQAPTPVPEAAIDPDPDLNGTPIRFLPSRHGFAFRNTFTGTPLPDSLDRLARSLGFAATIPDRYGLCGGMSLAAADLYLSKQPAPDALTPPSKGTPLYDYLYQRQLDSYGRNWALVSRVLAWMALPDDTLAQRSKAELELAAAALDRGELVPLCMVLVAVGQTPWDNHQVLAYAHDSGPDSRTFRVYDPNHPHDDGVIIRQALPDGRLTWAASSGRTRTVRGVFVTPFAPAPPHP